jgi:hypothetical protein
MRASEPDCRRIQHVAVLDKDAGSCALACFALGRAKTPRAMCYADSRQSRRPAILARYQHAGRCKKWTFGCHVSERVSARTRDPFVTKTKGDSQRLRGYDSESEDLPLSGNVSIRRPSVTLGKRESEARRGGWW